MESGLYLDVRMIADGSARWLWQLRGETALYGAGVTMSRDQAQRAGEDALAALGQKELARQDHDRRGGWTTDSLNLDELDRLDREEGANRRKERGDGHTEESDPAGLGGL